MSGYGTPDDLAVQPQRTAHEIDFLRVMEVVNRVIKGVVKLCHGTPNDLPYRTAQRTVRRRDIYGESRLVSGRRPLLARRLGDSREPYCKT